ncbi:hypothetical protein AB0I60_05815 [Actinosynnema sp. NPDC050436]|uniref:hypothetical protein n=1 Tax=Actinosynnema sp. NPDC050436 TaxID=3155659 RepID=UPI0033FA812F
MARISVVGFALAIAGALAPQAGAATAPPRSFGDCMDIAVEHADVWVAHDACDAKSTVDCYRIFYKEYGRQEWALRACQARNNEDHDS